MVCKAESDTEKIIYYPYMDNVWRRDAVCIIAKNEIVKRAKNERERKQTANI